MNKAHLLAAAGEHRVASELLVRGLNVGMFFVDDGTDLITETGLRIQVKAARKAPNRDYYSFSCQTWKKRKGVATEIPSPLLVDYLILWAVDDDIFFVIPANIVRGVTGFLMGVKNSKYAKYRNDWQQIMGGVR